MKKIAFILSVATILSFAACSDNSSNNDGGDQVKQPVMNSGPETEAERAKEAVRDTANANSDSTIIRDADAPSSPH